MVLSKPLENTVQAAASELLLTITATFTAEPIGEFLRFWASQLGLGPVRVEFSAYNQVFQELLSPNSLPASRWPGANLLLIRLEDWARERKDTFQAETITATVHDFNTALTTFVARAARRPTFLVLCPPSQRASADPILLPILSQLETEVRQIAASLPGLNVITSKEIATRYPVFDIDDPENDREAHIPFTRAYWAAMATAVMRKMRCLFQPPHKVIVVDADNTLWSGVVGEVGPGQVGIEEESVILQKFLQLRRKQGMLLALVSKNKEADVEEVFRRPDMILERNDFVSWRVNWDPKSQNIVSLAQELELGLSSFMFLDDNPLECAEVAANCPAVSTLLLPSDARQIPNFLEHVWAFDVAGTTAVDEQRTELYHQQNERNQFKNHTRDFREFIEGLQLHISLAPLLPAEYERAAQLTQRTTQFNTSGKRRTAFELSAMLKSRERSALLIRVRDRFGDYGVVGLAIFSTGGDGLIVETFLISCRVLGKGVEHCVLAALGREALRAGAVDVAIPFTATDRNQPAENFLKSVGGRQNGDGSFHFSSMTAVDVVFDPEYVGDQESPIRKVEAPLDGSPRTDFLKIATELNSVEKIVTAALREGRRERPQLTNELVRPRTSREIKLAKIWQEVLNIDSVGVTDSFLSLGGQSLQAASIVARIANEFGLRIPLTVVLSGPTIAELSEHLDEACRIGDTPLLKGTPELVLSPAQERLWFLDQFIPNRAAYNIPLAHRIRGPLQIDLFERAIMSVALRHITLRSSFAAADGGAARLTVAEVPRVPLERITVESEAEALALANKEARRPFDLAEGPLLRCLVIRWGSGDHLLVLNIHHAISDGWSMGILMRDLATAYAAARKECEPNWRPLEASYLDYAAHQRKQLVTGSFGSDLTYWTTELCDVPSLLELPTDKPRPSASTYEGASVCRQLSAHTSRAIQVLAETEKCTPFAVLLAAWQALLHRYSEQEDIVVGVPVMGRSHSALEELIGCFVNTLAIRSKVHGSASFLEHLQSVRGKVLDALAHQELPFEHLVSELGLERDLSRSPLFQVMLVLQESPSEHLASAGLEAIPAPLHNGGAKFDLVLEVTPSLSGYRLTLEFNTSLFLAQTAERILAHFTHLLAQACAAPGTSLAALALMDEHETQQMLRFVNREDNRFHDVACLHHWFERCVAAAPHAPALSCEGRILSYGELNRRANQIAHHLKACGVGPDSLVGICLDRSLDLITAILGVLKAGGAYLPIDLAYPADRLAFMLEDSQARVLLTERKLVSSLPETRAYTICLDDAEAILSAQPVENPKTFVAPDHMAYVIYTSGSTGKPKGCMVTHRNVARLLLATERWFGFNERDVWTLFHSSAFDFSVWEIWGALLYGGRLVIVPFLVSRSPEAFYELLAREQVTVLNQTPSAFRQLIHAEESIGQKTLALRYVIFGGEALEMQSLRPWFERHGDQKPQLVNMYGITETTVHVTYRPLSMNDTESGSVIGVPIPDLQIYILDPQRQPVPIGVPGEMYVGGAGLARGYLHRPQLTEERFIPDHLTGRPGARLYRTGDRARFLPDHDIEYLGRIDHQVKIRGFRIELGEIESVLCQYPAVREARVIVREDTPGAKRLVAYLVTPRSNPETSALREHLKQKLPDYMVPAAFVCLEHLPLTTSGKIDVKALPVPDQRTELARTYVAPRTPIEETLAAVWSKVLSIEQVGVNDNFFALGGDSILSIQVISQARREGLKLTPKLLFGNQTIAELAAVTGVADVTQSAPQVVSGHVPLTPIQQWFFEQHLEDLQHYNQAFLFEVAEPMDRLLLESAFRELNRQHDALRLLYRRTGDGWHQFYSETEQPAPFSWTNLAGLDESGQRQMVEALAATTEAGLHLEDGPLWRAVYFDLGPGLPGRLLFVVHHLAVDGVSWRLLLEDLETAYGQLKAATPVQLPPKTSSYKTWSERLEKYAGTSVLAKELPYWKSIGTPQAVQQHSSENTEASAVTFKVALTAEETSALLHQVPAAYNTQINDVLLTALLRGWSRSTGERVLFTNLEGHGRENLFDDVDVSRTVGWFTAIFPVRLELADAESDWHPGQALKAVKEQLRKVPHHGVGYGILRYLSQDSGQGAVPEPPMVFNYLGQFDQVVVGSKLFRFARESSGPWHSPNQRRRYALEANGLVIDGRLELSWTYARSLYSAVFIEKLANEFLRALRQLIDHCQSPEAGGRTPSDFALARLDQSTLDGLIAARHDVEDIYPLSPIQTLFYSANSGAASSAFDHWHCTLRGELNVPAFERAWRETLERHPILRSSIHGAGLAEPLQIVHRDPQASWTVEDWRGLPPERQAEQWFAFLKRDGAQPLNLEEAPVMRFALLRLTDETWKFLWSVPALLLDGWSWPLVFRDASRLYEAFSEDLPLQLERARPYRDYVEWLSIQPEEKAREFWRESLAGFREPIPLPGEAPATELGGDRYGAHVVQLSVAATEALQSAARRLQLTLSTLIQGAWAILLNHQSGSRDLVFGAAFAGRPTDLPGAESIVGPFVNNLPVRVRIENTGVTIADFVRTLHASLLELSPFQFTPLMEVRRLSEMPWQYRLFDSLVVFQNYQVDESARCFGGRIDIAEFVGPIHTNYPLTLLAEPGAALRLTLIYDRHNVSEGTVERWALDLKTLLEQMPDSLDKDIADLQAALSPASISTSQRSRKLRIISQNFVPPQTKMEETIADVWQTMFGLEQVGVEENLFDLGGHSLLVIQMHSRLREVLKIDFPIVTLFEHPTVRLLARHLGRGGTPTEKNGEQWRDRAQRQKQALAQMRTRKQK